MFEWLKTRFYWQRSFVCYLFWGGVNAFAQKRPDAPIVPNSAAGSAVELIERSQVNCSVTVPDFSIVIGNLAKVHPLTFPIGVTCTPNKAYKTLWYAIKPGWDLVYCYHIHGQADIPNKGLRWTGVGFPQPAGNGKPYIPGRMIYFRLSAPDDLVAGGQYMTVGTAGGVPYDITGYLDAVPDVYYNFKSQVTLTFVDGPTPSDSKDLPFPPSKYTYGPADLHFVMAQLNPAFPPTYVNACSSNSDLEGNPNKTISFHMSFEVKTYCQLNVKQHLDFGLQPSLSKALQQNGIINVDCSAGTDYKLIINHGNNYDGSSDYMKRVSDDKSGDTDSKIRYNLNFPTDCPNGTCTGEGTGLPQGIDYDLSAEVPQQPTPPDGKYRDTIVITLDRTSEF